MLAVCNTTPLNYLIQLGLAELLHRHFGGILIPRAVMDELCAPGAPQIVRDWMAARPTWLSVGEFEIPDEPDFQQIHPGEIAAIALAESSGADLILIDDIQARLVAVRRGHRVSGTLGVLRDAVARGMLSDLAANLQRLRGLGFHISQELFTKLTSIVP